MPAERVTKALCLVVSGFLMIAAFAAIRGEAVPTSAMTHPDTFTTVLNQLKSNKNDDVNGVSLGLSVENTEYRAAQGIGDYDSLTVDLQLVGSSRGDFRYSAPTSANLDISDIPFTHSETLLNQPSLDDSSVPVTIPHIYDVCVPGHSNWVSPNGFTFFGINYQKVWVSPNGYLSFLGPTNSNHYGVSIPNPLFPNGFIAPFFTNLKLNTNGPQSVSFYCYDDYNNNNGISWDAPFNIGFYW